MFSDSIAFILSTRCPASITISAVGGLFAILTLGSRHIRWFLPLTVPATGLFIDATLLANG